MATAKPYCFAGIPSILLHSRMAGIVQNNCVIG